MIVLDKEGNEIEIRVSGGKHDLQIVDAYYVDGVHDDQEVTDETVDYIMETQYDMVYEAWLFGTSIKNNRIIDSIMERWGER